jgi:hypothetical protein
MKNIIIVLLILLIPIFSYSASPYPISLTNEDKEVLALIGRARYWADILIMKSPKYVWGGEGSEGGDCSGQAHWILKKAGAPFPRTTAFQIYHGAWPGYNESNWENTIFPDGVFFSWKKPGDHMGLVDYTTDYPKQIYFIEASSGAGKFKKTSFKKESFYDKHILGIRIFDFTSGTPKSNKLTLW